MKWGGWSTAVIRYINEWGEQYHWHISYSSNAIQMFISWEMRNEMCWVLIYLKIDIDALEFTFVIVYDNNGSSA